MYDLTASVHKGTCSKSNIKHNRREIPAPHTDKNRKPLNEVYRDIPIEQAYHELFDEALEEYNKDKIPCRRIDNYYEHLMDLFSKNEEKVRQAKLQGASYKRLARIRQTTKKPYYELIVSLGNYDSYDGKFRNGGELEDYAIEALREYMYSFEERNPNLYVFGAYMHRDEPGVPHWHINYIAWTDMPVKSGLKKRVSEIGAFEQMGLVNGKKYGTVVFQERERAALKEIAKKHNINIVDGHHGKHYLEKQEYILNRKQIKTNEAVKQINEGARQLIKKQDEFSEFIRNRQDGKAFIEHLELKAENAEYHDMLSSDSQRISEAWSEFQSVSADYFEKYRTKKQALFKELQRARNENRHNQRLINSTLSSIIFSNDLFIIKAVKLFTLLHRYIKGISLDKEVDKLQAANYALKQEAKQILTITNETAESIRQADYERLALQLDNYDNAVQHSLTIINNIQNKTIQNDLETSRP